MPPMPGLSPYQKMKKLEDMVKGIEQSCLDIIDQDEDYISDPPSQRARGVCRSGVAEERGFKICVELCVRIMRCDNFVALYGTWIPNKQKLLLILVYAPQSVSSKRMLWSYLASLITSWNGESLIMGDFNEVRCIEERWGPVFNVHGANVFNSFISNSGLNDIQLEGYFFTWAHPPATKMSKLDRFLMFNGLLSSFSHISAICLDRHLLDHRPILLREVISDFGPTPFRFYHSWLGLPGFDDLVTKSWNSFVLDDSNGMIRFKKKLQMLKKEIHTWTLDYKRQQVGHSKDLKSKLSDIDKMLDQGGVTDDILLSRMEAIEGDENSKYFHAIVNKKRANLSVKGVMVDGDWIDDPDLVKHEFRSHFADRFQLCGDVFRKYWAVVGPDFSIAMEWFFEHEDFAIGCNSSFVALIAKVLDPKVVSDYRPISLIGSLYKVTKILATQLSLVISDLISDVQTAFLPNRQILDGPFIINEILARCKLKKQQAMILRSILPRRFRVDHSITLSHLFYDDAVFIGMSINIQKSHLLGVGIPDNYVGEAAKSIGCSIMKAPFKYLGILVGDNMSSIKAWDEAISKMKKRLSRWKLNTLSVGGLRMSFFNGIQDGDRKIALVKWSKVLASKKYEGLGVLSFYALNRALLFKWVWRYLSHDNSLWSRVINDIHGLNGQVLSVAFNSTWSSIINEVNSFEDKGVDLISHVFCEDELKGAYFGASTMIFEDCLFLFNTSNRLTKIKKRKITMTMPILDEARAKQSLVEAKSDSNEKFELSIEFSSKLFTSLQNSHVIL
nr:RNA-directed DNA polymerase, eukaryota [Tanacetum cinerariifolium]